MQAFANQQPPDIQALFSQFLAQLPPAQIAQLTGQADDGRVNLRTEHRTHVDTATAAQYMNRRPQTLRGWHSHGQFITPELRPLVLNGRLAWSVAAIKAVMGQA